MPQQPETCPFWGCGQGPQEHHLVVIGLNDRGNVMVHETTHYLSQGMGYVGVMRSTYHPGGRDREAYRKARNRARHWAKLFDCPIVDRWGNWGRTDRYAAA